MKSQVQSQRNSDYSLCLRQRKQQLAFTEHLLGDRHSSKAFTRINSCVYACVCVCSNKTVFIKADGGADLGCGQQFANPELFKSQNVCVR